MWGLGAFGHQGVEKVIEILLAEFTMVMRQTRTAKLSDITPKFVMEGKSPIMMRDNRFDSICDGSVSNVAAYENRVAPAARPLHARRSARSRCRRAAEC